MAHRGPSAHNHQAPAGITGGGFLRSGATIQIAACRGHQPAAPPPPPGKPRRARWPEANPPPGPPGHDCGGPQRGGDASINAGMTSNCGADAWPSVLGSLVIGYDASELPRAPPPGRARRRRRSNQSTHRFGLAGNSRGQTSIAWRFQAAHLHMGNEFVIRRALKGGICQIMSLRVEARRLDRVPSRRQRNHVAFRRMW